jgi:peptide/nickel transport system substrate-binding protein
MLITVVERRHRRGNRRQGMQMTERAAVPIFGVEDLAHRLTRRRLGLGVLGTGLAAALRPRWSLAAEATPKRGGTLVMVLDGDPPTLNPDTTTGVPDVIVGDLMLEGLTRIDKTLQPVPNLAESWTISPDNLRYTFKLVEARWHDGVPFTSADVKFTLERVSAKYGAKFAATAGHIQSIETPDDRTVVVTLDKPFGPLLFSLSNYTNAAILPAHVYGDADVLSHAATLAKPIGTGPFMFKEWVRGDHITLERNPNYWRQGMPYLDEIVLKIIPDPASRVLALKTGEIDYCYFYYFPTGRFAEIEHDPNLQWREQGPPEDHLILINTRAAPFNDKRVRQALLCAIDREFIRKAVYQGIGKVMDSAINSNLAWAANPDVSLAKLYPYDPKRAKSLLDAAGLKPGADGTRFDLRLVYDSTAGGNDRLSQVLQTFWQKIGVRTVFQGSTRNTELKQVYTDWDFDATLQAYSTAGDPALGVARIYISSAIRKAPFVNASGYSNPEVDRLFAEGADATAAEDRARAYRQAQVILAEDLPVLPIWQTALINVATRRVQGKWSWSTGYDYWEDVWLEE